MSDDRENEELRDEVRRLRIRVELCRAALGSVVTAQDPRDVDRARSLLLRLEAEDVRAFEAEASLQA